jgi:hypothetical protein
VYTLGLILVDFESSVRDPTPQTKLVLTSECEPFLTVLAVLQLSLALAGIFTKSLTS